MEFDFSGIVEIIYKIGKIKPDTQEMNELIESIKIKKQNLEHVEFDLIMTEVEASLLIFFIFVNNKNSSNAPPVISACQNIIFLAKEYYLKLVLFLSKRVKLSEEQRKQISYLLVQSSLTVDTEEDSFKDILTDLNNLLRIVINSGQDCTFKQNLKFLLNYKKFLEIDVIRNLLVNSKPLHDQNFKRSKLFPIIDR